MAAGIVMKALRINLYKNRHLHIPPTSQKHISPQTRPSQSHTYQAMAHAEEGETRGTVNAFIAGFFSKLIFITRP